MRALNYLPRPKVVPAINMNGCRKSRSGEVGMNVYEWVTIVADVLRLVPAFSESWGEPRSTIDLPVEHSAPVSQFGRVHDRAARARLDKDCGPISAVAVWRERVTRRAPRPGANRLELANDVPVRQRSSAILSGADRHIVDAGIVAHGPHRRRLGTCLCTDGDLTID